MIQTLSITEQIIDIYLNRMNNNLKKMPYDSCKYYFNKLLEQGNIIYHLVNDEVKGFGEYWLINRNQLLRIMRKERFDADSEQINRGRICYIADLWIDEEFRQGNVLSILKRELFTRTKNCSFYIGEEHKHNKRLKTWAINNRRNGYGKR